MTLKFLCFTPRRVDESTGFCFSSGRSSFVFDRCIKGKSRVGEKEKWSIMWVNKMERCTPAASQRSVQVQTHGVYFSKWFVLKKTTPETNETLLTWGFPERRTRSGHSGVARPHCRSSSGRTEGSSGTTTPRSCRGRLPLPGSGSSVPSRLWERQRRRERSVDKCVVLQNLLLKVSYSTHFEISFLNNILQWSSFAWLNQHLAGLLSFDSNISSA